MNFQYYYDLYNKIYIHLMNPIDLGEKAVYLNEGDPYPKGAKLIKTRPGSKYSLKYYPSQIKNIPEEEIPQEEIPQEENTNKLDEKMKFLNDLMETEHLDMNDIKRLEKQKPKWLQQKFKEWKKNQNVETPLEKHNYFEGHNIPIGGSEPFIGDGAFTDQKTFMSFVNFLNTTPFDVNDPDNKQTMVHAFTRDQKEIIINQSKTNKELVINGFPVQDISRLFLAISEKMPDGLKQIDKYADLTGNDYKEIFDILSGRKEKGWRKGMTRDWIVDVLGEDFQPKYDPNASSARYAYGSSSCINPATGKPYRIGPTPEESAAEINNIDINQYPEGTIFSDPNVDLHVATLGLPREKYKQGFIDLGYTPIEAECAVSWIRDQISSNDINKRQIYEVLGEYARTGKIAKHEQIGLEKALGLPLNEIVKTYDSITDKTVLVGNQVLIRGLGRSEGKAIQKLKSGEVYQSKKWDSFTQSLDTLQHFTEGGIALRVKTKTGDRGFFFHDLEGDGEHGSTQVETLFGRKVGYKLLGEPSYLGSDGGKFSMPENVLVYDAELVYEDQ